MKPFTFQTTPNVLFEPGAAKTIAQLVSELGARRVLFLVDRRALAAQAVRAFASFEPEPNQKFDAVYQVFSQRFRREDLGEGEAFDPKTLPPDHLLNPQPKHTFVYVCTIQRMAVNLFGPAAVWSQEGDDIDDDARQLDIPIHAFDLSVADECHRGYSAREQSIWRNTLDHFDAIKLGLTATPAARSRSSRRSQTGSMNGRTRGASSSSRCMSCPLSNIGAPSPASSVL